MSPPQRPKLQAKQLNRSHPKQGEQTMPAVSKAQRRFMGMCEHNPKHAAGKCPDMSQSQMSEFASTSEKELPMRKSGDGSLKNRMTKNAYSR